MKTVFDGYRTISTEGKITYFAGITVDNMFVEITYKDGTTRKYSLNHIMNNT